MGTLRKIAGFLNPFRPFKVAAKSTIQPALRGLEIIKDLASRLPQAGEQVALPANYDPYEHFRDECRRFGLDKARLVEMEKAHLRSKRVAQLAMVLTLSVAAGFFIAAESALDVFIGFGLLLFSGYCSAKNLQLSVRLRQVRARALYSWPQFCALFPTKMDMVSYLLNPEF
ncbi:MAG: hypothetical protein IT368_11270 [Candidatus Hydrogenedentes bacterium]|nr:hypothetical protein [Candidatus Hydrogenedentota bacterium]